jgi:hypothetical protein
MSSSVQSTYKKMSNGTIKNRVGHFNSFQTVLASDARMLYLRVDK